MSSQFPPDPPKPSKEDLAIFRDRTQRALKAAGISARTAEKRIGCATGTCSKVYKGRIALTLKLLREIAEQAKVQPNVLVEGTGLEHLLLGAPETPESLEMAKARATIDGLRADLAERDASIAQLRAQLDKSSGELEAVVRELAVVRSEQAAAVESARQEREQREREAKQIAEATQRALVLANSEYDQSLAEADARLAEVQKQLEQWRGYGLERHQRVNFLETELAKGYQAAQQKSGPDVGHVILGTLAALGIGAFIGSTTNNS